MRKLTRCLTILGLCLTVACTSVVTPSAPTPQPTLTAPPTAAPSATPLPSSTSSPTETPTPLPVMFGPEIILYRGDAHRSGVYPFPAIRARPELLWETNTHQTFVDNLILHDGELYSGSSSGKLFAFEALTGDIAWSVARFGQAVSPIALAGDVVLAGGNNQSIQALNRHTGEGVWTFTGAGRALAQPLIVDHRAYVAATNTLYALNLETGEVLWTASLGNVNENDYIGGPAYEAGALFLSVGKAVLALEAETGALRWRIEKEEPFTFVALDDSKMYVGNNDGFFYAFEQATGEVAWKFESGAEMWFGPAVTDDTVYVGAFNGFAYALDSATGAKRWEFDTGHWAVSDMVFADDVVYFSNCNHEAREQECHLYAREAQTGEPLWDYAATGTLLSTPVLGESVIYMVRSGSVLALR